MEINEKIIRIIGGSSLAPETKLELGQDITVEITGNVLKIEEDDLQDGTKNLIYKVKQISAIIK